MCVFLSNPNVYTYLIAGSNDRSASFHGWTTQSRLHAQQGTALGVIFEPILCCRLFLSTHEEIMGEQNPTTAAVATTGPTAIEMNSRRPHLDSLGYPKLSSALLYLYYIPEPLTELTIPVFPPEESLHEPN